jgi:NADPH-dependent 2,4-dienoyl-CoA reductase/sulfur reductase-like enzyme
MYQPSLTMIGGGVLGKTRAEVEPKESKYFVKPMADMFVRGQTHRPEAVVSFDPDNNSLKTDTEEFTYDYLVVATGIELNWEKIPGMKEALDDPDHPAGSIYNKEYAYKILEKRQEYKGGESVFINPAQPIKCGGAP